MLKAKIFIEDDVDHIASLLEFEEKEFQNGRASYGIEKKGKRLEISINANDSVSLRSALNTITKVITVQEKAKGALKNEIASRGED